MQPIPSRKRTFYIAMGGLCLFLSSAILTRIGAEFYLNGATTYGQGIPFQYPVLQIVHVVAGIALWCGVLVMGAAWCWRAVRGTEVLELPGQTL